MTIEIKTTSIEPLRHTFDNVARRIGGDKPASRYLEAMYDLQATANFHYRPYWDPEHELYDKGRTAIVIEDWYVFKDPRQFYYGAWTMTRSKQQDATERNFNFVDKRNLADTVDAEWRAKAGRILIPLRHLEYAANLNNCYIAAYGYGTATTQAAMFAAIDRLGVAQYLSRIGLILDKNTSESLDVAKNAWLSDPIWQPLRALCERLLVTRDWFELLVAQNFVLDGLLYPLIYDRFDKTMVQHTGTVISMLTEFMNDWYAETSRWVDMMLKTAAEESSGNKARIEAWVTQWRGQAMQALDPVAEEIFGERKGHVLAELESELIQRAGKKCGLEPSGPDQAVAS